MSKYLMGKMLPVTAKNLLRAVRRRMRLSPMWKVLRQLEKRNATLKDLNALEVFGGFGDWHTMDYASEVSTLEVGEINPKCEKWLKQNLPMAKVNITDSYRQIRNTLLKYSLIVVDNPAHVFGDHCEHFDLVRDIFRIAADSTIVILNVVPEINEALTKLYPYLSNEVHAARRRSFYKTNHPEKVSFDEMIEVYTNLIVTNGFHLEWYSFKDEIGSIILFLRSRKQVSSCVILRRAGEQQLTKEQYHVR